MKYDFEIKGDINAETLDDAIDILQLLLESESINITKLEINDKKKKESVSIPKSFISAPIKPIKFHGRRYNAPHIPNRYPPKQKQKLEGKGEIKK